MHKFEQKLIDSWACQDWGDLTILLAISGGGDSTALLRSICAVRDSFAAVLSRSPLAGQVVVAHFNHHLRGRESDGDEQFVISLCEELGVRCLVGSVDTESPKPVLSKQGNNQGEGLESLARQARYTFLENAAAQVGARYLVTAHTYNDQAETVLHRIIRGTGLRGLGGIARVRRINNSLSLIRPMLDIRREEVLEYLRDLGQPFREDASNADKTFTRNRLRHDLLPMLQREYNPAADEAVVRLARLAQENLAFLDQILDQRFEASIQIAHPDLAFLRREALRDESPYLLRELMIRLWTEQGWPQQAMGYEQWDRLASLIKGETATDESFNPQVAFPGGVTVEIQSEETISISMKRFA